MAIGTILVALLVCESLVSSLPAPYVVNKHLKGRFDFFLHDPYFVGLPFRQRIGIDSPWNTHISRVVNLNQQFRTKVDNDDSEKANMLMKNKQDESMDQWPGRHDNVNITNAAGDVVIVYKKNLRGRMDKIGTLNGDEGSSSEDSNAPNGCVTKCGDEPTALRGAWCAIRCVTEGNEGLKNIASDIFNNGIIPYCTSMRTVYGRSLDLGITSLQQFQTLALKIDNPSVVAMKNIPWRALLTKLIQEVPSPLQRFRKVINSFEENMEALKVSGRSDKQLVGENPACAQMDLIPAVTAAADVLAQDPALTDHLVFQGYGLMDALTKYLEDFPMKKNFAAQHFVYDLVLGTTCGLILFGTKGETTDCDQYGGYPVIDMPVPDYMWKEEAHGDCEKLKEKLLLTANTNTEGAAKRKRGTTRAKRSMTLKIGR